MNDTSSTSPAHHAPISYRPREACRIIGVSLRTLGNWTSAGLIPCIRVGTGRRKTVLYSAAALQDWLAKQASATPTK